MALNKENMEALTGMSPDDASKLPRETADVADQQQSHPEQPRQVREPARHIPALSEEAFDRSKLTDVDEARQEQPEKPPMMVPNSRVTEEADKRRAIEERYNDLKSGHDKLSERFTMMLEAFNARQEAEQTPQDTEIALPDPNEDLPAYLEALNRRDEARQKQIDELKSDRDQFRQQHQYQEAVQQVRQRAAADELAFSQNQPDFRNAYQWWRNSQVAELAAMGVDQATAQQHVDGMELQISHLAQQQGQNSAERFYRAAQARGWQAQQTPVVSQQRGDRATQTGLSRMEGEQNVASIAAHPQYQPQAQSLDNMNAGMLESRSLDEADMGGTAMPMDLEQIANLSDAEFMQRYETLMPRLKSAMR